jgi:inosine-uridine nucleoside N-ribohydrolase
MTRQNAYPRRRRAWAHGNRRWLARAATVLLLPLILFDAAGAQGPVPLIFDTDMGNDVDDALALGLIHALQRRGDCRLIAVTLTKDQRYAAPLVDVVNTFYGYGEIPIGVVRGGVSPGEGNYLRQLACAEDNGQPRYPHKLRDGRDAPEATALLRRVLAAQGDGSVVIVQVGFSTNLARLLDSKPDEVSPLDGLTLVRRKVRLLSAMAGNFAPAGSKRFKEFNVATDVASAKKLFQQWPTPIVVSGFEVGNAIVYPHRSIGQNYNYVPHHPLAEAYRLYMKMPYDRPTWDLTSALYAIWPDKGFFGLSGPGRVVVEDDGVTRFQAEEGGPRRYLTVSREQALRVRDAFASLCSERPSGVAEREKQQAEADRRRKVRSTRTTPEARVQLANPTLRLDFDPRGSDTGYNYIWVRRPGTDRWERVHNFGIDVGSYDAGDRREMNCVGVNLSLERTGRTMKVTYPSPLVQYRQFDDRIGTPELIRKYPEFTADEARRLVHADASLEFRYEIDPQRPSFVVSGRVLRGRVNYAVYIVDALWTDNHFLPTHELVEGQPEYDPARPEGKKACAQVPIEKVRYAIFYRRDGEGVPFALLPLLPDRARVCNYFDNWKCLYDFRTSELNQQFVPDDPPVTGANDTGYLTSPRADGGLAPVRVAFFPELGWGQGGKGDELRQRIVRSLKQAYPSSW